MPYRDYSKKKEWNKLYQRKAKAAYQDVQQTLEQQILAAVRQSPGVFSAASLYEHFEGKYSFAAILKMIDTLRNGLIDYDQKASFGRVGTRKLVPVPIPKITLIPMPSLNGHENKAISPK